MQKQRKTRQDVGSVQTAQMPPRKVTNESSCPASTLDRHPLAQRSLHLHRTHRTHRCPAQASTGAAWAGQLRPWAASLYRPPQRKLQRDGHSGFSLSFHRLRISQCHLLRVIVVCKGLLSNRWKRPGWRCGKKEAAQAYHAARRQRRASSATPRRHAASNLG